jgi:hypothetical protein
MSPVETVSKRPRVTLGVAALLLCVVPAIAQAARGTVVYNRSGCDYFIVSTQASFALLEWYGGHDPAEGDAVAGDFETYGMKDIFDLTADAETQVWVEDFWLSRSDVIEKYWGKCP